MRKKRPPLSEIGKYLPDPHKMRWAFPHVSAQDHRDELARIIKVVGHQLRNGLAVSYHLSDMPYTIPRRTLVAPSRMNVSYFPTQKW